MDMKKFRHIKLLERGRKGDTARLSSQLAPLEEKDQHAAKKQSAMGATLTGGAHQETGAIVVETHDPNFSTAIAEKPQQETLIGIEPLVLVILIAMLVFIAFIAWQISLMPVKS
jgi:hypothetical protein